VQEGSSKGEAAVDLKLQGQLFAGFFRAGMLGYGGGPSSIPLIHIEVVGRYSWMTDEEFGDVLALANTLPGPIATKMAGYIGYRTAGWMGLAAAIIATVLPTVLIMACLVGVLSTYRQSPIVRGMTEAIAPIIAVMLAPLAYTFLKEAKSGLGWVAMALLGAVSFVLMELLHVHPGLLIGFLLAYGLGGQELKDLLLRKRKVKQRAPGKSESM
jgi:chromate transporter